MKYGHTLTHENARKYFVLEVIHLLGRFASLSFPTIAVVNKAAVGGGCMLSFAHDYIFVKDKAFFSSPEIDLSFPIPEGMNEILKLKNKSFKAQRDMCLFGKRFHEKEALKLGMIDGIIQNLEKVMEKANQISKYG